LIEAADGFLAFLTSTGAPRSAVKNLASLLGAIAVANRPKLPTIATDTDTPHG
jgi:hypothetical protein